MRAAIPADQAREIVRDVLLSIAPDADLEALGPDDSLRDSLELDSLDFLSFVEQLSQRTGRRIDEDDYENLRSLSASVEFLSSP